MTLVVIYLELPFPVTVSVCDGSRKHGCGGVISRHSVGKGVRSDAHIRYRKPVIAGITHLVVNRQETRPDRPGAVDFETDLAHGIFESAVGVRTITVGLDLSDCEHEINVILATQKIGLQHLRGKRSGGEIDFPLDTFPCCCFGLEID